MLSFDFITQDDFRKSLEDDWKELQECYYVKAWKSVHVLAGSIIEALLIDCLHSSADASGPPPDLLKKDLATLISLCKDACILSDRTAQLSTVIRSYRNLIHPGRVVRLQEKINEQSATIARSLVEITIGEVEERKRKDYGYTANQIVKKVESDPTSMPIIPHLINDLKPAELKRLLLTAIPDRYLSLVLLREDGDDFDHQSLDHLGRCFRIAFEAAPTNLKKATTEKFVSVVKESDAFYVQTYETIFFRGSDLQYLGNDQRVLITAHLLAQMKLNLSPELVAACTGLTPFLSNDDLADFVNTVIRAIAHNKPAGIWGLARNLLISEYQSLQAEGQKLIKDVAKARIDFWKENEAQLVLQRCADIRTDILGEPVSDMESIPF